MSLSREGGREGGRERQLWLDRCDDSLFMILGHGQGFIQGGGGAPWDFPPPARISPPPKFENYYVIIAYTWSKTAVERQYTITVAHLQLHVGLMLTTTEYDDYSL